MKPMSSKLNVSRRIIRPLAASVGIVALVLSGTTAANASQISSENTTELVSSTLSNLGLYTQPSATTSYATASAQKDAVSKSTVSTSEGLVVTGPTSETSLTIRPANASKALSELPGLAIFAGEGQSAIAFTDASSGKNAGYAVIYGPSAPTSYDFEVLVGGNPAMLKLTPEGAIQVYDPKGAQVNVIQPAWATDAAGKQIRTSYTVSDNTITQSVDHAGATYPVVADPQSACDLVFCTIEFNRAETATIADNGWQATTVISAGCALLAGPLAVLCGAAGGAFTITASQARAQGDCVGIRALRFGQPPSNTPFPVIYNGGNCR